MRTYKINIYIYDINSDPLEVVLEGNNIDKLKMDSLPTIQRICKEDNTSDIVHIEILITVDNDIYYDSDEFDFDVLSCCIVD